MSYHIEKGTNDLVIDGFDAGIAVSPHKGIANMKAVDISTEPGEVMCSYARVQQSQAAISAGTLTRVDSSHLQAGGGTPSGNFPVAGSWITASGGAAWGLANGNYFVYASDGTGGIQLSTQYDPGGTHIVTGMTAGTASYTTAFNMGAGVQSQTEKYVDASHVTQYRYYILDSNGRLWVYDTALTSLWNWFLPKTTVITTPALGLGLLNGTLFIFGSNDIWTVSTVELATGAATFAYPYGTMSVPGSTNPHFAFTGRQGTLYYTDGNYIGSIFPNTALDTTTGANVNIQSYCQYSAVTTTGTITALLSGSVPATSTFGSTVRIPAFFMTAPGGTLPTAITSGTKYYIDYTSGLTTPGTFKVYAAASGGAALDMQTGAAGLQYFNTFFTQSSDGATTFTFTQTRVTLPNDEVATAIAEVGNMVLIGTRSNVLYLWNQIDALPGDLIFLPESNVAMLVTVNNMAYIFAGSKGNIYITNSSTASLVLTVPDYCSGLIEPYFAWGGAMYLRGRVWFSIQDQTASHTGNCGGIWSFVPTQNFYIGQDTGLSLRMDNRPIDGTFNGKSTLLIPNQNQNARGPQYWDVRTSDVTTPLYSINYSGTTVKTAQPAIIETDLIPVGTLLNKKTFQQIEYKLSAPTDSVTAETVAIEYRVNLTDSFTSVPTVIQDTSTDLSGYFQVNFQASQWLQLRVTLTPNNLSTSSFIRLKELRVR